MFKVRQYEREDELEWNNFVENSKQGTFLFNRSYMDYHADRFHDCSLMVYRKDRLYALLPANRVDTTLYSHQGLTYGGLITNAEATAVGVCEAFLEINKYLYGIGIQHVLYKCMPWIYHRIPAEEDLYALFHVCKARLIHRYIASTIDQTNPIKWRKDRQHGVKSALKEGVIIERKSKDLDLFWDILTNNLQATYHAKPVHTLEEMTLLTHHFPVNIPLYMARQGDKYLAGVLLYVTSNVVHTQYISATTEGKELHAVDAICHQIIKEDYKDVHFFDFGTSNEDSGDYLNAGLIQQKEGFGARAVCYDQYEWDITEDILTPYSLPTIRKQDD